MKRLTQSHEFVDHCTNLELSPDIIDESGLLAAQDVLAGLAYARVVEGRQTPLYAQK